MAEIWGLSLNTIYHRLPGLIEHIIISLVIFFVVPDLLFSRFSEFKAGESGLGLFSSGVYVYYAGFIIALGAVSYLWSHHFLGDAASIANGVTQIAYIFLITNGGVLTIGTSTGAVVTLNFTNLLYLLVMPSALGIVSTVVRLITRSAAQAFNDKEEVLLRL